MTGTWIRLYVHLVWSTWDRQATIGQDNERRLYECMAAQCLRLRCEALALGGWHDHVHAVVRLAPGVAVSDAVRAMKSASSNDARRACATEGSLRWQHGYGARSLSPSDVPDAIAYVHDQKRHHAQGQVRDDWEDSGPAATGLVAVQRG